MGRPSFMDTVLMATIVCVITVDTMVVSQQGCCYYYQYEGKMYITTAEYDQTKNVASLIHTEATFHLDHQRQMFAMDAVSTAAPGDVVRAYTLIEDFNKGQGWYITGKNCYKIPIKSSTLPAQCIPDNATLLGQFNIGSSEESVQTWVLPNTGTAALLRFTLGVNGCVPIQTTSVDAGKTSSMTTTQYGNLTKGIIDPTVFQVPTFCHQ